MKVYLSCLCLAILFSEIASLLSLPKNLLNLGSVTTLASKPQTTVTTTTTTPTPNVLSLKSTLANLAALTSSLSLASTQAPDDNDLASNLTYPLLNDTATDAANIILPSAVPTIPSSTQPSSIQSPTNLLSDVTNLISPFPAPSSINASPIVGDLSVPLSVPLLKVEDVSTSPITVPLLKDTVTDVDILVSSIQPPVSSDSDSTASVSVPLLKDQSVLNSPITVPFLEETVTDVDNLVSSLQAPVSSDGDSTASISVPLLKDEGVLNSLITVPLLNDTVTDVNNLVSSIQTPVSSDGDSTASISVPLLKDEGVLNSLITVPLLNDTVTDVNNLVSSIQTPVSSDGDSTASISVPLLKDEGVLNSLITVPLLNDTVTDVNNLVSSIQTPVSSDGDSIASVSVPLLKDQGVLSSPITVPLLEEIVTDVDNLISSVQAPVSSNDDSTASISVPLLKDEGVLNSPIPVPLLEETVPNVDNLVSSLQAPVSSNDDSTASISVPLLKDEGVLTSPVIVPLLKDAVSQTSTDIKVANQAVDSIGDLPNLGGTDESLPDQNGLGNIYSILSGIPGLGELTGVTNLFSNTLGLDALTLALPGGLSGLFSDIADALSEVDGFSALLIWILAVLSLLLSDISVLTRLPLGNIVSSIPVLRPVLSGLLQLPGLAAGFLYGLTGFVPGWGYSSFRLTGLSLTGRGGLTDILNSVLALLTNLLSSTADLLNGLPLASTLSRLTDIGGLLQTLLPGIDSGSLLPRSGSGWTTYDDLYRYRDSPLIDFHDNEINGIKIVLG